MEYEESQLVSCQKCNKKSVPKLWHVNRNIFVNKIIQHLCPYCGHEMHKSGGGVSLVGWFVVIIFVIPLITSVLFGDSPKTIKFNEDRRNLTLSITSLEKSVDKYGKLVRSLESKMENGKNPHLLSQVENMRSAHQRYIKRKLEKELKLEQLLKDFE